MDWENNKQDVHGASFLYPQDDTNWKGWKGKIQTTVLSWRSGFYTATKKLYSLQVDSEEEKVVPWSLEPGRLIKKTLLSPTSEGKIALWQFFTRLSAISLEGLQSVTQTLGLLRWLSGNEYACQRKSCCCCCY